MSNYLIHYNHNHDALGRFARSAGSTVGGVIVSKGKKNSTRKYESAQRLSKKKGSKSNNTKLSESDRNRLVNEGSTKEIIANKEKLSNRELETAINRLQKEKVSRIDLEKKLTDLDAPINKKKTERFIDKVQKAGETLNKANTAANRTIDAYNTMAKIHNSLSDKNHQWTLMNGKAADPKTSAKIENIIKTADVSVVFANRSKMTNEEYRRANDRLAQDIRNAKLQESFNNINKQKQQERIDRVPVYTAETQEEYERLKKRKGTKWYDSNGNEWTSYY